MKTVETQEENQNLDVLHKTLLQFYREQEQAKTSTIF